MRNWYNRKWLVIHEAVAARRGRNFEHKVATVAELGFKPVGSPTFFMIDKILYGTVLMRKA